MERDGQFLVRWLTITVKPIRVRADRDTIYAYAAGFNELLNGRLNSTKNAVANPN